MGKTLEEYINEKTICSLSDKEIHISDELLKTPLEDFSDGYHTFKELYDNRAKLFAVICHDHKDLAWKSKKHFSDKDPMYDGMFIVGIETPMGPASYHYNIDPYWDIFDVPELDHGLYYDGYSPDQAIDRILSLAGIFTKPIDKETIDFHMDSNIKPRPNYKIDNFSYYSAKRKKND